jgi:epoxyqueuosine reductase
LLGDESPLVRGAAVWALGQLVARQEFEALGANAISNEHDDSVREEWQAAS